MKIHIIGGTGEMGNWLRNFLESQKIPVTVSGSKGIEDKVLKESDVIFISVPISKTVEVITDTAERVNKNTVLIDLSSIQTKGGISLKKTNLPSACLHFLFGPTITSLQNQNIILSVVRKHKMINKIKTLLQNSGANVAEMNLETHDKLMVFIQNLTHFVNLSLAQTLLKNKIDISGKISTPPFLAQLSVLSRIISQDPDLLTEIQLGNDLSPEILNEFIINQEKLLDLVIKKDSDELKKTIAEIHQQIESTPKAKKKLKTKPERTKKITGKVAFLGPKGTFSHQVALLVSKGNKLIESSSIYQIFEDIDLDKAEFGVVPAENSTEGTIRETLDYLIDFTLKTNGSINLPIRQNLISKSKNLKDIKLVISHPQAIAQCRNWLRTNLPDAILESSNSTVSAMKEDRKDVGFIASKLAARLNNLPILEENIEDNHENITKFYLISKKSQNLSNKKTLLFLTVFNRVGILKDILTVFANLDINLSKIESRPSREKVWDYHFFIEVEVSEDNEKLQQALNILKQYCPSIKVIGGV